MFKKKILIISGIIFAVLVIAMIVVWQKTNFRLAASPEIPGIEQGEGVIISPPEDMPEVIIEKPQGHPIFGFNEQMEVKVVLKNFHRGGDTRTGLTFHIDNIPVKAKDELGQTCGGETIYHPQAENSPIECLIDLPSVKTSGGSQLTSGGHTLWVNVARFAQVEPKTFTKSVKFVYGGGQIWIKEPAAGQTYWIHQKEPVKVRAEFRDMDFPKHIYLKIDGGGVLLDDIEDKNNQIQAKSWDVGLNNKDIVDRFNSQYASKKGVHNFVVEVYRYNDPTGHLYKNNITFCLTRDEGAKCAADIGDGSTTTTRPPNQPGRLSGLGKYIPNWKPTKASNVSDVVQNLLNGLTGIAGALLVLMLTINGFRYLIGAGNEEVVASAKKGMIYAVIGLVIILAAYAIIVFVGTKFGLKIEVPILHLGG